MWYVLSKGECPMTELFYSSIASVSFADVFSTPLADTLQKGVEKYTDPQARAESYALRLLLQKALPEVGISPDAVRLCFTEEGKPYFVGSSLFISLSHSKSYVALALSDTPCGVDVEDETSVKHPHQLAKRFFTEDMVSEVREATNPALAFLSVFTRMEATVKQKEGLTLPLAKDCLSPVYYSTKLPLGEGKKAVLTAVGDPPFCAYKLAIFP